MPAHLRDSHYSGAAKLGHGVSYKYAHDYPNGYVKQQYLPTALVGRTYYEGIARGKEKELMADWNERTSGKTSKK